MIDNDNNPFFIEFTERWGCDLIDFMFGNYIRHENLMKKELLNSILPYKNRLKYE